MLSQVQMISFQCSSLSLPEGIVGTFRQCAAYQKDQNLNRFVSVVVLDNIDLAEDSPRMPLTVDMNDSVIYSLKNKVNYCLATFNNFFVMYILFRFSILLIDLFVKIKFLISRNKTFSVIFLFQLSIINYQIFMLFILMKND